MAILTVMKLCFMTFQQISRPPRLFYISESYLNLYVDVRHVIAMDINNELIVSGCGCVSAGRRDGQMVQACGKHHGREPQFPAHRKRIAVSDCKGSAYISEAVVRNED